MFSLSRTSARQITRPFIRSLANVINAYSTNPPTPSSDPGPSNPLQSGNDQASTTLANRKVSVREDHGLYAFFRKRRNNLPGEDGYEVVESPEEGQLITGRAWEAAELRNKSFKDLHTLWYVALREKNLLATQKEEARRMGVANVDLQVPMEKVRACRKTMARIKAVLNERRLAYEGAAKLAEAQLLSAIHEQAKAKAHSKEDQQVLEYQRGGLKNAANIGQPTQGRRRGKPKPRKSSRAHAMIAPPS